MANVDAAVEGLQADIGSLGQKIDQKAIIEKLGITKTELDLNDGLVAGIFNRIALKE